MDYLKRRKQIFNVIKNIRDKGKWPNREEFFGGKKKPQCQSCGTVFSDAGMPYNVCPFCGAHHRLSAYERLNSLLDEYHLLSFENYDHDPLSFPGYADKKAQARNKTGLDEAVIVAKGRLDDVEFVFFAMDANFMMGSMGLEVGRRISKAFSLATKEGLPVVGYCTSGGARMQEGIFSLMQMAKTTFAARQHDEVGLFYVAILTDPTTGGVTASFASLADVILAEPAARICFTGRRVIEQTIKETLPEDFQTAEFLQSHGFVDAIVPRPKQYAYLKQLLRYHR